jgi:hypothetical protein
MSFCVHFFHTSKNEGSFLVSRVPNTPTKNYAETYLGKASWVKVLRSSGSDKHWFDAVCSSIAQDKFIQRCGRAAASLLWRKGRRRGNKRSKANDRLHGVVDSKIYSENGVDCCESFMTTSSYKKGFKMCAKDRDFNLNT